MATTTSVQRNLTQLTVKGSSMTAGQIETAVGEAADAIADAMAAPTDSIGNTLTLWDVNLTPVVAEELVRLIRTSQTWDSVSLRNCSGDSRLCDDLYLACTTHRSLKSLEIQHAFDHPWRPTPTATIQAFAYGIRYNARLESLDLEGLRLDASMANLLSRALVRNTTLRKLGLEETFFVGTTATSAVEATVTADRNDENGSNNNNNNKNGAVQILSFGLRFNRTIESLALDRCKPLGDEDLACLINAVNSNGTVLRCLSLQGTPCHSESMQAVALLLQENVIEDLDMSYLERKRKKDNDDDKKDKTNNDTTDDDDDDDDEPETKTKGENDDDDENENENDEADESKTSNNNNESESGASDTQPDESKPGEADNTAAADDSDPDDGNNEPEEDSQRIENTSLKRLAMVGNGLNDDYLASLLGIFAPPRQRQPRQRRNNNNNNNNNKRRTVVAQNPSRLEELSLYGNRFSNHGVKELLKLLPRFPYLQRLYLGFQQQPPPALLLPLSLRNANHPSLEDRTTRFQPGLLDTEFVTAVADNPCNFRLTDVHIVTETARDEALKKILTYHTNLNDGGRRILAPSAALSSAANDDDDDDDDDGPRDSATATATTKTVPLGLWSLVLDRANRLYPLPSSSCPEMSEIEIETKTKDDVDFHAGDVIYCLLHGPMVFDNLDNNE